MTVYLFPVFDLVRLFSVLKLCDRSINRKRLLNKVSANRTQLAIIRSGSQVANSGNQISNARTTRSKRINGMTPLYTSEKVACFYTAPITANRLIPTGGVTTEISISLTKIMPNQIGSIFNSTTIGNINGSVMIIIDVVSKKHPKMMYMIDTRIRNFNGVSANAVIVPTI